MLTRDSRTKAGSRSRLFIALATMIVAAGAAVTMWSLAGDDDVDEDAANLATELADTWVRGFDEDDPDLVMSIFTGNGIFVDEDDQTFVGQEIRGEVVRIAALTTNVERIDGLEKSQATPSLGVQELDSRSFRDAGRCWRRGGL